VSSLKHYLWALTLRLNVLRRWATRQSFERLSHLCPRSQTGTCSQPFNKPCVTSIRKQCEQGKELSYIVVRLWSRALKNDRDFPARISYHFSLHERRMMGKP
jgi:hypothetical protein